MKPILLLATGLAGFFAFRAVSSTRRAPDAPVAPSVPNPEDVRDITRRFLVVVVLPVWLTAGVADWICHRRTGIERTTGLKES